MKDFALCFLYCLTSLVGETGGTWIYMDYQDIIRAVFDHGLMTMSSLRIFLNWKCTSWDFTNSYADGHKKMYNKPVSGYQPRCNSKEKTNNPPHHIFHDYQKMLVIYDSLLQMCMFRFQRRKFPQMSFAFMKSLLQEYNFLSISQGRNITYIASIIWIMR